MVCGAADEDMMAELLGLEDEEFFASEDFATELDAAEELVTVFGAADDFITLDGIGELEDSLNVDLGLSSGLSNTELDDAGAEVAVLIE